LVDLTILVEHGSAAAAAESFVAYPDGNAGSDRVCRADRLRPVASVRDFVVAWNRPGPIGHLVEPFENDRARHIVEEAAPSEPDLGAFYDLLVGHNCRTRCRNLDLHRTDSHCMHYNLPPLAAHKPAA